MNRPRGAIRLGRIDARLLRSPQAGTYDPDRAVRGIGTTSIALVEPGGTCPSGRQGARPRPGRPISWRRLVMSR